MKTAAEHFDSDSGNVWYLLIITLPECCICLSYCVFCVQLSKVFQVKLKFKYIFAEKSVYAFLAFALTCAFIWLAKITFFSLFAFLRWRRPLDQYQCRWVLQIAHNSTFNYNSQSDESDPICDRSLCDSVHYSARIIRSACRMVEQLQPPPSPSQLQGWMNEQNIMTMTKVEK